ncbi:MAG: hypothetical protein MJ154_00365 [Candidatus Saccharibacteria bacterium]|nr:hypothetical protein [Candidatus Saccharibacteria bacterium]
MGASSFFSYYGGDLKTMLLRDFVCKGKGDDFVMPMDEPINRHFGTLAIDMNTDEYSRAIEVLNGQYGEAMLVGIEDLESGSPYVFVQKVEINGNHYMFPIILNAEICDSADDGAYVDLGVKSFSLRLGNEIDPDRKCSARVVYAAGKRIEWNSEDIDMLFK